MDNERFKKYGLAARVYNGYDYVVTGRGEFPMDMLRYDSAWPATSEDAVKIADSFDRTRRLNFRSILMRSYSEPTIGRWSSFGWSVGFAAMIVTE